MKESGKRRGFNFLQEHGSIMVEPGLWLCIREDQPHGAGTFVDEHGQEYAVRFSAYWAPQSSTTVITACVHGRCRWLRTESSSTET